MPGEVCVLSTSTYPAPRDTRQGREGRTQARLSWRPVGETQGNTGSGHSLGLSGQAIW